MFEGIDISEFPETAEEIPSNEDTAAASESDFYEEDMDAESENGQELLLMRRRTGLRNTALTLLIQDRQQRIFQKL